MKHLSCIPYITVAVIFCSLLFSSCAREYDLSGGNLDLNITIGGDSLMLPIGSTERLTIGDFMDLEENENFKVGNSGEYYFEMSLSMEEKIDLSNYLDEVAFDGLHETIYKDTFIPKEVADALSMIPQDYVDIELETADTLQLAYDLSAAKDMGLMDLDSILFDDAYIRMSVDVNTTSSYGFPDDFYVTLELSIPEKYHLCDSSGHYSPGMIYLHGDPDGDGHITFDKIDIEKIAFDIDPSDEFIFEDVFVLEHLSVKFVPEDMKHYADEHIYLDIHFDISSHDGEKIVASSFSGLVDYSLEPLSESLAISGIPDFLMEEGVNVDFVNAYALVDLNTNSGVPFKIDMEVTSVGTSNKLDCSVVTPLCPMGESQVSAGYLLAEEQLEGFEQYQWYPMNINELFNPIPETIDFLLTARTDISTTNHYVELNKDYFVSTDFKLVVPLSFGSDMYVPVRDTITGLPEWLGEILEMGKINLLGTIETTVPMDMNLKLSFIGSNGELLDIPTDDVTIEGTQHQGTPVLRDFMISVERTHQNFDIYGIVMELVLMGVDSEGIPVTEDCYMDVDLGLMFPDGISVDLNEYFN